MFIRISRRIEMTENLGDMISRLHNLKESLKETRAAAGKLELEIIQLMEASGQTLFEDTKFKARIPIKREYDVNRFKAVMGEELSPEQMNEVYSEAHEITKEVPASVNGSKAKKLWDMGFGEKLEQTLLPNKRQLRIEKRKEEIAI
jgi:regulator of replication initiation timing